MKTKLFSKEQVVIPLKMRKHSSLPAGTAIDCKLDQPRVILSPYEPNANITLITDASCVALEAPAGATKA